MADEVDYGRVAHRAAMEHLAACWEAFDSGEPSPASAPFDGCPDCEIREVLSAAWPRVVDEVVAALPRELQAQARAAVETKGRP